jgi:hypothetical protein
MFFIRSRSNDMRDRQDFSPCPLGATTLPIMIALPLDRQGLARVDSRHEFKISLAAFGVKP